VPKYTSPNFHASQHHFYGNENAIKLEGKGQEQVFEYDPENNQQTIRIKKQPYTPLNVYKALLKIALCSVDETDLAKYELAFQFLASPNIDKMLQGAHLLVGYRLPNAYETPFGMLFKKVDDNMNATTHTFVLFYKSMMLQIFLPFHLDHFRHYSDLRCPALPPLFDGTGDEKWVDHGAIYDNLASTEVKRDGEEVITFQIDPASLKDMVCFDPKTNKFVDKQFDFSEVASIIIVDDQFTLSREQLEDRGKENK
jgi:hypothetical protein